MAIEATGADNEKGPAEDKTLKQHHNSTDLNLSKPQEGVEDREACTGVHGVKELDTPEQLSHYHLRPQGP